MWHVVIMYGNCQCRKIQSSVVGRKKEAAAYFYIESGVALLVSLFINVFVVSVFGKGFYGKEGDIGLENAGHFLGATFGPHMKYIWAIGLLAAGQIPPFRLHLVPASWGRNMQLKTLIC